MKKITYLPHHYRAPSGQGGLRTWHQVNELVQHFNVTVIVPGVDTLSGHRHESLGAYEWWSKHQPCASLNVFRVNSTTNDRTRKWRRALYYLSFSTIQFFCGLRHGWGHVVVTTSMPVTSMMLAYVLAIIMRVPLVVDVRDLPTDLAIEIGYFRDSFLSRVIRGCESFVYRRAKLIVVVSAGMRDLLLKKGAQSNRVHVVPIGYDKLEDGDQYVDSDRVIAQQLKGKFVVLYSGTMGHVVDIETVLDAAQRTVSDSNIVYLLVGDGQRIEEYKERAKEQKLNVIFTGRVKKQSIAGFCQMASVCLYPLVEGKVIAALLGNKIFDYMGAGRATIYTGPDGDVAQLIRDANAGIILGPRNVEGLVQAIKQLQSDTHMLDDMGRCASEYVCQNATAQQSAVKLAHLIEGITNE